MMAAEYNAKSHSGQPACMLSLMPIVQPNGVQQLQQFRDERDSQDAVWTEVVALMHKQHIRIMGHEACSR